MNGELVKHIDFFAGTSTGSIIALGLAASGLKPDQLVELYNSENGSQIMPKSPWDKVMDIYQDRPKYDGEGKRRLLEKHLGSVTSLDSARKKGKHLLVTAYDVESRKPMVLTTTKARHHSLLAYQVADCSSAAPCYFPTRPLWISHRGESHAHWLIDGGVVANDPSMTALSYAMQHYENHKLDQFRLISVGTGTLTRPIPGDKSKSFGVLEWMKHDLLGIFADEHLTEKQARALLGKKYLRVNSIMDRAHMMRPPSDAMDDTSPENIERLLAMGDLWFERFGQQVIDLITQ